MSKLKDHAINALNTKLNNDDNVEPKKKRRRLGTRDAVNKENISDNFKPTLICSACIAEGNVTPFIANYPKDIDVHLKAVHATIVCGLCFQEKGIINKFVTEIIILQKITHRFFTLLAYISYNMLYNC